MARLLDTILTPQRRIIPAILVRFAFAAVLVVFGLVTCTMPGLAGGLFRAAFILIVTGMHAVKWSGERGLWMFYAFWAVVETALWIGDLFFGGPPAPSPWATNSPPQPPPEWALIGSHVLKDLSFLLVLRLMVSVAVHNWRFFSKREIEPGPHQQPE